MTQFSADLVARLRAMKPLGGNPMRRTDARRAFRNPDGLEAANIIECLATALLPFAALDVSIDDFADDMRFSLDGVTGREVTVGEVRRARQALAKIGVQQ